MDIIVKLIIVVATAVFFTKPPSIPEVETSPAETASPTPTQLGFTTIPTAVTTSTPKINPVNTTEVNKLIYPKGTVITNTVSSIKIESESSPDDITNFYKDFFEKNNSKVKSFVTTNTNGNILNKLAGVIDGKSITIEIKKDNGSSKVYINIDL